MKICFIATVSNTLYAFAMEMAEYLHSKGVEVCFICKYDVQNAKYQFPEYIKVINVDMRRGNDIRGIKTIAELTRIFRKENFDLVQYATPNAALYASIASRRAGVRNRLYAQWGIFYVSKEGMARRLYKTIEKTICKMSTHVQPISMLNRKFGISEGLYSNEKSSVIGIGSVKGIDFERFNIENRAAYREEFRRTYSIREHEFVFGFVARITRDKGINEALEAFIKFNKKHKNTKLLVCGEEDHNANINTALYEAAKKNENIVFCGYIKDVPKIYAAMDVFLFPTYREGFGEVSLEAQAMGTPVITTSVPGPAESVKYEVGGIHITPRDSTALFNAMERLYNNRALLSRMSQKAPKWVKDNFDSEKLIREICEFKIKLAKENQ